MSKLDDLNIDAGILTPATPRPRGDRTRLPKHLKHDFEGELAILERVLERSGGTISGFASHALAWAARTRFYWARSKHRFLAVESDLLDQAPRFDRICITIHTHRNDQNSVFWYLKFEVATNKLALDGEEIP